MIIRHQSDLAVSRWSGGTTTELFLYPEASSYAERNFSIRISTATVETERSEFTLLPGYQRSLMVLKGGLTMVHDTGEGTLRHDMKPFQTVEFDGGWKTTGTGKVTDFNVMLGEGYSSEVKVIVIGKNEEQTVSVDSLFVVIFTISGKLSAGPEHLSAGSVVVLENRESLALAAGEDAVLICVTVRRAV